MKFKTEFIKLSPQDRMHGTSIPIIGLTGGIATGKSTVSKILRQKGMPLIDADQLVKEIYREPQVIQAIQNQHPEVFREGIIQFPLLRKKFFKDQRVKVEIENLIYAQLPAAFKTALLRLNNSDYVIYDVPLLFEKKLETKVDLTVVVYASRDIQRARLMKRDGQSESMAKTILDQQQDIEEKKIKADAIIDNSQTEAWLAAEIDLFLAKYFSE